MSVTGVKVKNNDLEGALRKWKRQTAKDGTMRELKKREYYLKPGVKKRKKSEDARKRKFK